MEKSIVCQIKNISKLFTKSNNQNIKVLENINLVLREGEIIALLGKSGSGKSTLLRIIAGLIKPDQGEVIYRNKKITKPEPNISMIFQSFALMPWLTVLQNVSLGLEARNISKKEIKKKSLKAIDMIGLDGFENAYPKELSGGMCQRVGFARALVLEPDLLLMDEPFSALDILTSENLREDLLELWNRRDSMKGILYVTHSIEEAVLTADRIIIFGCNPGCIRGEIKINQNHPRNSQDKKIIKLIEQVYETMINAQKREFIDTITQETKININYRLPDVDVAELNGLLGEMDDLQEKGPIDLPKLADHTHLDSDELFSIIEILSILKLAIVENGNIVMTKIGKKFIHSSIEYKKILFSKLMLECIPLTKYIVQHLRCLSNQEAHVSFFIQKLQKYFSKEESNRIFFTFVDWARYSEIIEFDVNTKMISLDETNAPKL